MNEAKVLEFMNAQNRPFSVQLAADHLAIQGIRKPTVQKALEALSEAGKLNCKAFGKTNIFYALQNDEGEVSKEEIEEMTARLKALQQAAAADAETVKALRKAVKEAECALTIEEMEQKITFLSTEVDQQAARLESLAGSGPRITAEQQSSNEQPGNTVGCEQALKVAMAHWALRRRMFKEAWDTISENLSCDQAELFEEIGVETDEEVKVEYKLLEGLLSKKGRA